jgi:hypothetical protein
MNFKLIFFFALGCGISHILHWHWMTGWWRPPDDSETGDKRLNKKFPKKKAASGQKEREE